ncbi:hypothetical protein MRB53_040159 [Persea americana]|nr:hypothetical protein MRB53_040159 [Persea americana]
MKAAAQWCLLPLLQLAISAQLNPAAHKLSKAQDLSRLISQLQHLLLANFSLQGLSTIAILSLTGAFYAGSLCFLVVELFGDVRDSFLAWLDCDLATQISRPSIGSHMDAAASHPAVDPHFTQNNRSVSDLHASPQPSLRNHVVLERFLSMADAILMQSIQLPVEFLFLHLSARSLGPES